MENVEFLLKKIESDNLWTCELELKRNELLLSSGKIDSNLYFIVSGSLRLYVSEEAEDEVGTPADADDDWSETRTPFP